MLFLKELNKKDVAEGLTLNEDLLLTPKVTTARRLKVEVFIYQLVLSISLRTL